MGSAGETPQGYYKTLEKIAVILGFFGFLMFSLSFLGWLPW